MHSRPAVQEDMMAGAGRCLCSVVTSCGARLASLNGCKKWIIQQLSEVHSSLLYQTKPDKSNDNKTPCVLITVGCQ